ncbi:MAG: metallophosphoesterase [Caldilineales bacterium]|nr:metallophosphoesterase [Caldilineales bacterium]
MNRRNLILVTIIVIALLIGWYLWRHFGLNVYAIDAPITASPYDCQGGVRFAVIGDFGDAGPAEAGVAELVDSWQVDFIVTVGDNNYPNGGADTIDDNIGRYYQSYIYPYQGDYGPGAVENRFFPALGNHDWRDPTLQPYLDYFTLPGNERYYDLVRGPVHLFILDSDPHEPDGRTVDSVQAAWLQSRLAESTSPWQLVFMHHPPYASSLTRDNDEEVAWPFTAWGADAVFAGHHHFYERLQHDGIPYFVNGLGGRAGVVNPIYRFGLPAAGSQVRYNQDYGAMLVTADDSCVNYSFYNRNGELIDSLTSENLQR